MIWSLTLFVHVVGMLTLFVGLGLEWASLDGLQRSITREQALPWLRLVVMVPRVSGIAVAAIIVSGFYLGARVGVLANDWMRSTYGALLLSSLLGISVFFLFGWLQKAVTGRWHESTTGA